MKIYLPDGSVREFDKKVTLYDVALSISDRLAKESYGAVVNDRIMGLQEYVEEDSNVRFVGENDKEAMQIFWHTSAHVMALAILRLYPDVKFAIGPAIENGFYYDFDTEHRFTPEDFEKIEKEMQKIVSEGHKLVKVDVSREEALEYFKDKNEIYKVDLIEGFDKDADISYYDLGEFRDLCRGPHLVDVKKIKAIKLLSIAGAYWRGDEKNKMLQRIYAISFDKKKKLDEYLHFLEEAKRRDHRKIGKEMGLFSMHKEGPGFPFFLPKGMILRNILEDYWKKLHARDGYHEIKTPIILNEALWHQSGHWDHYKENMYFTKIDGEDYAVKPMNCPGSILIYKDGLYSYRDLPLRLGELGLVHRHELSGALHGLMRVRSFTQDDAHLYMLPSQIKDEIKGIIRLIDEIYNTFGFKYSVDLSTRPDDFMGEIEMWDLATEKLKEALEEIGMSYNINEGDGAFYGPKIDFQLEDTIGRKWQCATIQLDFQMPERFDLVYVDEKGEKSRPVMVHRTILGAIERFIGLLIEQYAGKFPLWIAPEQVRIIPVSEKHVEFADSIAEKLKENGFRVFVEKRNEKVGYKIRQAQLEKIPYMLVVGDKEEQENKFTPRHFIDGVMNEMTYEDFLKLISEEVQTKKYRLDV